MAHLARTPSFRLNLACAAAAALAFASGCSKQGAGTQAAAPGASAPVVAQDNYNNLPPTAAGTMTPATGTQPMPVHGSPAPTTSYANGGQGGDSSYAAGGDVPVYDAGDGQSGAPESVVSAYIDPPLAQPAPVQVDWAPPPMLVEEVPPQPGPDYVWTGGYWAWQGRWVWAAGRWSEPPRQDYRWQEPYYEHRGDHVVYVPGYWSAPNTDFIVPAAGIVIAAAIIAAGVHHGHAPDGPQGVFVPPPPGSRPGIIVPAPVGTPPAVVIGAPPVLRVGMRVEGDAVRDRMRSRDGGHDSLRNVSNVTIVAPQGTTSTGQAFQRQVPSAPRLAAAQVPVVRVAAPEPASKTAIPTWQPGHALAALPPAQQVHRQPFAQPVNARGVQPSQADETAAQRRAELDRPQAGPITARPDPSQGRQQNAAATPQQQQQQAGQQQPRAEQQQAEQRQQQQQPDLRARVSDQQRAQLQEQHQQAQQQQQREQAAQQHAQQQQQQQRDQAAQQHAQQAEQQRTQQQEQQAQREQQAQHAEQQRAEEERAKAAQEADKAKQDAEQKERRDHPADQTTEEDRR